MGRKLYDVGTRHETNNHGEILIIGRTDDLRTRKCKFLKCGTIKELNIYNIKKGNVSPKRGRITDQEVHNICHELKYGIKSMCDIAIMYDIDRSTISCINTGKIHDNIVKEYINKTKSIRLKRGC